MDHDFERISEWTLFVSTFHLGLLPETLFRALACLSGFLSRAPDLPDPEHQLAATACIWLAAKLEEERCNVPSVHVLRGVTHGKWSVSQVIAMEARVLRTMDHHLPMHPLLEAMLAAATHVDLSALLGSRFCSAASRAIRGIPRGAAGLDGYARDFIEREAAPSAAGS